MTRAEIPRDDGDKSLIRRSQSQNYNQIAFIGHRGGDSMSGMRRTDGLTWIVIGEARQVRSTEFGGRHPWGSRRPRNPQDRLCPTNKKNSTLAAAVFVHVLHELW